MIVDHLASPAVAGFSVSKIWGQGPIAQTSDDTTAQRAIGQALDLLDAALNALRHDPRNPATAELQ